MYTATDNIFFADSCPTTWLSRKLLISNGLGIEVNSKGTDFFGLSFGNRNYLQGLNLIGLRRSDFNNKDILGLTEAYKEIFATKNLTNNFSQLKNCQLNLVFLDHF